MSIREIYNIIKVKFEREFNSTETFKLLTSNLMVYFSWGVSKKYVFDDKSIVLKVSGRHHKGFVLITLGYEDLYNVYLISNKGEYIDEMKGLYFDQLTECIDGKVERIPEYRR